MLTSLEPFISAQDEVAAEEEKKIKKKKEKEKGAHPECSIKDAIPTIITSPT